MCSGETMKKNQGSTTSTIFVFAMTLGLCLLWSFLQPLYGSPDETAHVVKAVATASGQFNGRKEIGDFNFSGEAYKVPKAYAQGIQYLACILGPAHADASCVGPFASGRERTLVTSTAAHYPPLYYLLVGPAGVVFPGPVGMYLMRVVSSVLTAIMVTLAFITASKYGGRMRSVGVIAACTPMVFSLSGAVNPHGLEISSSILYWVTLLTCLEQVKFIGERRLAKSLVIQLFVASTFFALVRPAGFLWMSVATICILGYAGFWQTIKSVFVNTNVRSMVWPVPIALAMSLAFYFLSGVGSSLGGGGEKASDRMLDNIRIAFDRGDDYFRYMFGWFGWVEFSAPPAAFFVCVGSLGLVICYGAMMGSRREFRWTISVLLLTILSPIILEGVKAASSGFGYQGRYTLALAVGIPILGFWRNGSSISTEAENRLIVVVLISAIVPTLMCIDFALKRYSVGETGPRFWFLHPHWLPPGGLPLIVTLLVATLASFVMLVLNLRCSTTTNSREA